MKGYFKASSTKCSKVLSINVKLILSFIRVVHTWVHMHNYKYGKYVDASHHDHSAAQGLHLDNVPLFYNSMCRTADMLLQLTDTLMCNW